MFFVLVVMLYPMVFWILLRLLAPDYFAIPNRRLKVMSIVIVLMIALLAPHTSTIEPWMPACHHPELHLDRSLCDRSRRAASSRRPFSSTRS